MQRPLSRGESRDSVLPLIRHPQRADDTFPPRGKAMIWEEPAMIRRARSNKKLLQRRAIFLLDHVAGDEVLRGLAADADARLAAAQHDERRAADPVVV